VSQEPPTLSQATVKRTEKHQQNSNNPESKNNNLK
jgi:hypothetical protein